MGPEELSDEYCEMLPQTLPEEMRKEKEVSRLPANPLSYLAPRAGLEPATQRLTEAF